MALTIVLSTLADIVDSLLGSARMEKFLPWTVVYIIRLLGQVSYDRDALDCR